MDKFVTLTQLFEWLLLVTVSGGGGRRDSRWGSSGGLTKSLGS
jgi:hypothetical protein